MELGIIGLPKSGKTTVFNALTGVHAQASTGAAPSIGVVKVPDQRLEVLTSMFKPQRVVPAEVRYVDIPGAPEGLGRTSSIGGQYLSTLQLCDALLHVVRAFDDPSVPHADGFADPYRDISTMDMEFAFSDLAILERRWERLTSELKSVKAQERNRLQNEAALIGRMKESLSKDVPVREQTLSTEEARQISGYGFLTGKPMLILQNIDESQTPNIPEIEEELGRRLTSPDVAWAAMSAKLEQDLANMEPGEEQGFRESLDAGEAGSARMIKLSYKLLGLVSFLTTGPDEVRAWSVPQGTPAAKAAGVIHTDIERGFIRAEVVPFDDLVRSGSLAEARRQGVLRAQGRNYVVRDGDVINFLFNV